MKKYEFYSWLGVFAIVVMAVIGYLLWRRYEALITFTADFMAYWSVSAVVVVCSVALIGAVVVASSEVYHLVRMRQLERLRLLAEAEAVGLSVHALSANRSAVVVSPVREPVMLYHPAEQPVALEAPKPNLVDIMCKLDRVLLVGGTGAGKTELMKHYVSRLAQAGNNLTIIDPHSPSKLVGLDVIGAKLDFRSIEAKMLEVMLDVNRKYEAGQIAQDGNLGHGNQWLIVEEFRDIKKKLGPIAELFLEIMLVRARKAGYRFTIVSQNDSISSLGLEGDTGLLKGCERIEIKRDIITDQRFGYVGWLKSDRIQCQVPGLFSQHYASIPPAQLIIDQSPLVNMTPAQRDLAVTVARLNGDIKTMSRNEIFKVAGVGKNDKTAEFLDTLLKV